MRNKLSDPSRECVSVGAQTCRSLGHHLLHPHIFRPRALWAENRLHLQIQIPNAYPEIEAIHNTFNQMHAAKKLD